MKFILLVSAIVVILIVSYLLFFSTSVVSKDIQNYPSQGTEVIAFGDSLIEGVGSTEGNDFVSIVSYQLGIPIINLGKSGDTTNTALSRLDEVLNHKPKVVLLLLGGNDYLRKIPKEKTFTNLGSIIESIQNTGSIVVLLGVRGGVLRDTYKNDFADLAKQYQTAFVPNVLDGLLGNPSLMYDSIHPNDAGYKIVADKVVPVLEELLN